MSRVWVDGALCDADAPTIRADDEGFVLGLAVFETMLQEDGLRYFEEDHLARFERGARALGIPWPPGRDVGAALAEYGATLGAGEHAVRVVLSRGAPRRGPTLVIGTRPIERPRAPGVKLVVEHDAILAAHELEGIKTTNRARNVLARERARAAGAWDAILATEQGDLSECTVSNLFVVRGGELVTPPLERGCLAGVTRARLLDAWRAEGRPVVERRVQPEDVAAAAEVFLSSSVARIVPVTEVAGLARGLPGVAGDRTRAAAALLARLEDRYRSAARV